MEIYSSNFSNLYANSEKKLLVQKWKNRTKNMNDDIFKREMNHLKLAIKEFLPKILLINMQDLNFLVSPNVQKWVNQTVNKTIIETKVSKTAFIISNNIETEITVNQTISEDAGADINKRFFNSEIEAQKWLSEKKTSKW
ncbi:MAG: hypothetical protein JXR68_13610 [Bacteroidales bacterium]|nr:hypothetical protein [Bacteroidales bacterium]